MNETVMMLIVIFAGVIIGMFLIAFLAMFLVKRKHEKTKFNSLPTGGSDGSEYGEMLVQKYRNERIEKEL